MQERLFEGIRNLRRTVVNPETSENLSELEAYYHIIFTGIGGSGKTTLVKHLETQGLSILPTVTTRPRRSSDGLDRINVDLATFHTMVENDEFLYWHETNGSLQGFPNTNVDLLRSMPCVVDKSVDSVLKLRQLLPENIRRQIAFVYLHRPLLQDNIEGLSQRGDYSESKFFERTLEEIEDLERLSGFTDQFVLLNDKLDATKRWLESLGSLNSLLKSSND